MRIRAGWYKPNGKDWQSGYSIGVDKLKPLNPKLTAYLDLEYLRAKTTVKNDTNQTISDNSAVLMSHLGLIRYHLFGSNRLYGGGGAGIARLNFNCLPYHSMTHFSWELLAGYRFSDHDSIECRYSKPALHCRFPGGPAAMGITVQYVRYFKI
jgi:hypothetical protein